METVDSRKGELCFLQVVQSEHQFSTRGSPDINGSRSDSTSYRYTQLILIPVPQEGMRFLPVGVHRQTMKIFRGLKNKSKRVRVALQKDKKRKYPTAATNWNDIHSFIICQNV